MGNILRATDNPVPSGFGSTSTAEQVTQGIDASGLTVIITGGSSGIGAETARVMALRGAHVIIGSRTTAAGLAAESLKQSILQDTPSARIDIIYLELNSQDSVRDFTDEFLSMNLPLNILINNACVMRCPFKLSEDGIEMQFATNHIGHFLLTNLLLPKIKRTAAETGIEGRIVNLSSADHLTTYREGIRFDKINDEAAYNDKLAYGQSKLANILHANELARRLKAFLSSKSRITYISSEQFTTPKHFHVQQEEGANVTANSVDPGLTKTYLGRHSTISAAEIRAITTCFLWKKSIPQGAATTCYVALHPSVKGISGKYFADCNIEKTSAHGRNEKLARKLWAYSEVSTARTISVIVV
ncbi:short-chain dehydrogenase TIC 32, chloroplastic-like [Zingiber officinale]|uniref:short-chain dehydrogenase TIC 32, chloroplastic-like n=1 Tax=Zingiber officinale TaxID=94328 RepID=UPI001C4AE1EA|nr:short-chain dehydrogenase TIC 32, chloroplastic-like [Zingiber officinale]